MENLNQVMKRMGVGELDIGSLVTKYGEHGENMPDDIIINCDICNNLGWVHPIKDNGKTDYGDTVRCHCRKEGDQRYKEQILLKMCELPADTSHMTLDNFKTRGNVTLQESLKYAKLLASGDDNTKWLTLSGDAATGKTHLAIAIARAWLKRQKPAKYTYVPILLNELRAAMNMQPNEYNQHQYDAYQYRYEVYKTIPLLILDDLGVEKKTAWGMETLNTIIDYRLMNALPLVITTNCTKDELPVRIASRIERMRYGVAIGIDAPEYTLGE